MAVTAQAQPNIALIKYWGKRDTALNIPATSSLSLTLATLWTRTCITFDPSLRADSLRLNDAEHPAALARASACLDVLRQRAGTKDYAQVETHNNFPTGAGLASSASGFAALVLAASSALKLQLDRRELSILARRGSGSAARSLFGGFATLVKGQRDDGLDAYAEPLLAAEQWPLHVVVAVTSTQAKSIGSTTGMERSRQTSPFYTAWVNGADDDLDTARNAVLARDFSALAAVSEFSCMKMHAVMLATQPALLYWNGATVECMHAIRRLREREGLGVFFTVDAGPQVKAICLPADAARVAAALANISGVSEVLSSPLGEGAKVIDGTDVV
ncbi:MAG: diphosphomevalonate decarboxylase [Rhodanobacter sp.]